MRHAKVKCPNCGKSLGYQGYSRHMWFKHGVKGQLPNMAASVPTIHGVDLESAIHALVSQESAIQAKLDEADVLRAELGSISTLRAKLEELVDTYKRGKEELTIAHV